MNLSSTAKGGTDTVFTYDDCGRSIGNTMSGHIAAYGYRYDSKLRTVTSSIPGENDVTNDYDGF